MFTIGDIINIAVQIEENGEAIYREASKNVSNIALISLLQWLADEEAAHAKRFSEMKEGADKPIDDPHLEQMGRDILKDVLGEQSFSLKETDFSKMHAVREILDIAIEFEKDTVLFYEMIDAFIDEKETKAELKAIIEEERQHIRKLQEAAAAESTADF